MKRNGILNSEIASVLAHLGHTDTIVIADCGLPVPDNVKKIDLALTQGLPSFLNVFYYVMKDMVVEKMTLAEEIREHNPALLSDIDSQSVGIDLGFVPHADFKKQTESAAAVIRTGEATPYANVILHAGVIF